MASGLRELNETLHFFRGNSLQVFLGTLKHWADRQIKDFVSVRSVMVCSHHLGGNSTDSDFFKYLI